MAEYIQNDWRRAPLTEPQRAMLEYAEKLTLSPSAMEERDIQGLRDAGWTDRDILDIVHVCAYFNFRVRVVDGLGLSHSEESLSRAAEARAHAAELAAQRGMALPADIWGIAGELTPSG